MAAANIIALARDERGAAAIEYGLICALIALAIVASVTSVGKSSAKTFNTVDKQLGAGHGGNGHGKGGGNSGNGKGNGGPSGP